MNVTWVKLTLEEARGLITGYTVVYVIQEQRQRKEEIVEFVYPEDSYGVIGGLYFTANYSVTVSTSTRVGQGKSSTAIIVHGQ